MTANARHIDRASPNDLTNLAVDRGRTPMNIGAVLVLDGAADLGLPAVRALLGARLPRVRRLRQLLVPAPLGGGRPLWVDDTDFDLDRHLSAHVTEPGDDAGASLLRVAADLVCAHLPRDRPLWHAGWVTVAETRQAALVLVVHHVLADGLGGLAVLAALADEGTPSPISAFPEPSPARRELIADAWQGRARTFRGARLHLRTSPGVRELGLATRPRLAPATSLNRPTGQAGSPPWTHAVDVIDAACRRCTVNDVALAAIVGAMAGTRERREAPALVGRVRTDLVPARHGRTAREPDRGYPAHPAHHQGCPRTPRPDRGISRCARALAPGASATPLGLAFRTLGRAGPLRFPSSTGSASSSTLVTVSPWPRHGDDARGKAAGRDRPDRREPGQRRRLVRCPSSYAGVLGITRWSRTPTWSPDQGLLTELLARDLTELGALIPRPQRRQLNGVHLQKGGGPSMAGGVSGRLAGCGFGGGSWRSGGRVYGWPRAEVRNCGCRPCAGGWGWRRGGLDGVVAGAFAGEVVRGGVSAFGPVVQVVGFQRWAKLNSRADAGVVA